MTNRINLSMEDLEKVTGGNWTPETLDPEDYTEYFQLWKAFQDSLKYGGRSPEYEEAKANYNAFCDRMDEKYGVDPNPFEGWPY